MSTKSVKSVLVAIIHKEKILLVKRRDVPVWVLPGGGVDEGESLEEAALREIKEETGLDIEIERALATYYPGGPFIKPVRLFLAKLISDCLSETAPEGKGHSCSEVQEVAFYTKSALPQGVPPPFTEFIHDSFARAPYFERVVKSITRWFVVKNILLHPILAVRFLLSRAGLHINTRSSS